MPSLHPTNAPGALESRGPYFDELTVGQVFDSSPAVTLTEGLAAAHQAIVGNRCRASLSHPAAQATTGRSSLAYPGLVWDMAIGQSTTATHHVRANLYYRGLAFHHFPSLGETLSTTTTVAGLKENSRREGRPATGLAAFRITTTNQDGATVLDFWRCAMIPLSSPDASTTHRDDVSSIGTVHSGITGEATWSNWDLDALAAGYPPAPRLAPDQTIDVVGADVVSSAPELARLTGNVAAIHHDADAAGGSRLVYGGHTIGLALAQLNRALPHLATVLRWARCDHLAPVHEGDALRSRISVHSVTPVSGGQVLELRSQVTARQPGAPERAVLDWELTVLVAGSAG